MFIKWGMRALLPPANLFWRLYCFLSRCASCKAVSSILYKMNSLCRNPVYIGMMKDAIMQRFLSFLSIDSPNNNVHNIRVCSILVSNSVVLSKTLQELEIPSKVTFFTHSVHFQSCKPVRDIPHPFIARLHILSCYVLHRSCT